MLISGPAFPSLLSLHERRGREGERKRERGEGKKKVAPTRQVPTLFGLGCGIWRLGFSLGFSFRGAKGGKPPVGRTQARDPTAKPEVGRALLGRGDLGPAAGAIPMRTTCVRGTPSMCNARVSRKIVIILLCGFLLHTPQPEPQTQSKIR